MHKSTAKNLLKRALTFLFHPSTVFFYNNFRGTIIYPSVRLKGVKMMKIVNSDLTKGCSVKCFKTKCIDKYYMIIKNSYFADRCYISSGGKLFISNATCAPDVFIGTYKHDFNCSKDVHEDSNYRIKIDDYAYIGQKTAVVGNVVIGKKSVIGAGSVVTKSIPDYTIAVGNPARVIKKWDYKYKEWKRVSK